MTSDILSPFERIPALQSGTRCVLLDAAADAQLNRWVYQLAPDGAPHWAPLFSGTPYAPLGDAGPALVLCDESGEWADYASVLLEKSNAGCVLYLENMQDWAEAVKHLQSLLTVSTEQGQTQLMRFFEPRWMEPLTATLTPDEQHAFLGPFAGLAWRNELGWRYLARAKAWDGVVQPPGWLQMRKSRLHAMAQARLGIMARELARDYQDVLHMFEPEQFVFKQLLVAQQAGVERKADYERWLRLALTSTEDSWPTAKAQEVLARNDLVMAGKLDEMERLLG